MEIEQAGLLDTLAHAGSIIDTVLAPSLRAAKRALIAIDAPLGWPANLSRELSKHQAGQAFAVEKDAFFQRATDQFVRQIIGKKPLEVGADKIARAAHSALAVLDELRIKCEKPIPLAWDLNFTGVAAIEIYPGGTLKARALPDTGYKKPEQLATRQQIAASLTKDLQGIERYVNGAADIFDACICLSAAKDFLEGRTIAPREPILAKKEGWIWIREPGSAID
ncbi:MAG: DUF429 domain-containing protein [Rhodocyclaceae bacterium]|nr:DUF429 domain-containing protein [Rhodocyclaceae bacterium]